MGGKRDYEYTLPKEQYRKMLMYRDLGNLYDSEDLVEWLESEGWETTKRDRDRTGRDKGSWVASRGDTEVRNIGSTGSLYHIADEMGWSVTAVQVCVIEFRGGPDWPDHDGGRVAPAEGVRR